MQKNQLKDNILLLLKYSLLFINYEKNIIIIFTLLDSAKKYNIENYLKNIFIFMYN